MNTDLTSSLSQYITAEILKQPGRKIDPREALISSGIVDSFNLVDLALHVEDAYGVHIDDIELNADTFDTLEQLVGLIEKRQAKS